MMQAYSQMRQVLNKSGMTVLELHRRIEKEGTKVNLKSLYRLSNDHEPVERLDLRVAGAICQVCKVSLSDLIRFEAPTLRLQRFSAAKQKRLDALLTKNTEGKLAKGEAEELRVLVREAEEMTLVNARILAKQRRRLAA